MGLYIKILIFLAVAVLVSIGIFLAFRQKPTHPETKLRALIVSNR